MIKGKRISLFLMAGILSGTPAVSVVFGQSNKQQAGPMKDQPAGTYPGAPPPAPAATRSSRSSLMNSRRSKHADNFYKGIWGIDDLQVRWAASGDLLRFSYRVTDANRARMLNDKKTTPYLIDERTGAVLQVPTMPKVGMLRQTADPANGREYWMVFSNKGLLKPGSRVDVLVGNFRANGLVVR